MANDVPALGEASPTAPAHDGRSGDARPRRRRPGAAGAPARRRPTPAETKKAGHEAFTRRRHDGRLLRHGFRRADLAHASAELRARRAGTARRPADAEPIVVGRPSRPAARSGTPRRPPAEPGAAPPAAPAPAARPRRPAVLPTIAPAGARRRGRPRVRRPSRSPVAPAGRAGPAGVGTRALPDRRPRDRRPAARRGRTAAAAGRPPAGPSGRPQAPAGRPGRRSPGHDAAASGPIGAVVAVARGRRPARLADRSRRLGERQGPAHRRRSAAPRTRPAPRTCSPARTRGPTAASSRTAPRAPGPTRSCCCTCPRAARRPSSRSPGTRTWRSPGTAPSKLNAAFSWGGAPLLVQTVEGLTGLTVDHYAEIGMARRRADRRRGRRRQPLPRRRRRTTPTPAWCGWRAATTSTAPRRSRSPACARPTPPATSAARERQRQLIGAVMSKVKPSQLVVRPGPAGRADRRRHRGADRRATSRASSTWRKLALAFRAANGPDGITGHPADLDRSTTARAERRLHRPAGPRRRPGVLRGDPRRLAAPGPVGGMPGALTARTQRSDAEAHARAAVVWARSRSPLPSA